MFRQHWREIDFWRWWWRDRASVGAKVAIGMSVCVLVVVVGFLAAQQLSEANAGVSSGTRYVEVTTIQKVVTVREHGKRVVKRVPVVRRIFLHPQTAYETRYDTRVVTKPVSHKSIVTVDGKTKTVVQTRVVPTTRVRTATSVVTNQSTATVPVTIRQTETRTVYQTNTTTVVRTKTLPPNTDTVTVTETETVTVPMTITIKP
jgi:hypothetical protein